MAPAIAGSMGGPFIKALLVLDPDGNRIASKFYDKRSFGTKAEQAALEGKLFTKTKILSPRAEADVITVDNTICVYKHGTDAAFYVVGDGEENEVILAAVLDCFYDSITGLLRGQTDWRSLLDNLDLLLLTMDELIDAGIILEMDPQAIMNRVTMRGIDNEVPLTELTISQALASAKEQLTRSWLK